MGERLSRIKDVLLGVGRIAPFVPEVRQDATPEPIAARLMAGMWGMNFKAAPELNWARGYPFAWAMILASALVPLAWFNWKGWV